MRISDDQDAPRKGCWGKMSELASKSTRNTTFTFDFDSVAFIITLGKPLKTFISIIKNRPPSGPKIWLLTPSPQKKIMAK